MAKTKGEYRVDASFNPSANGLVDQIKRHAAHLIDLIESIPVQTHSDHVGGEVYLSPQAQEIARCKALAQTEIEAAAMWAVKAATKPSMEK